MNVVLGVYAAVNLVACAGILICTAVEEKWDCLSCCFRRCGRKKRQMYVEVPHDPGAFVSETIELGVPPSFGVQD